MQCDLFIQEGARLGRTPAEVVSTCDITFACVSDPKAAKDVRIPSLPSASQVVARKAGWPPPLLPYSPTHARTHGVSVEFLISGAISHCEGCLHKLNTDFFNSVQRIKMTRVSEVCIEMVPHQPHVFLLNWKLWG